MEKWKTHRGDDNMIVADTDKTGDIICLAPVESPASMIYWDQNKHLIQSAPDLLEALENLENDDGSIPEHAWNLCQSAINRAKGIKL